MKESSLVPANEIWYTTTDRKPIELPDSTLEKTISNTYKDGKGVIVFKEPVVEIGEGCFRDCINLWKVVIPEGVTKIEACAFNGCTGLCGVVLPSSVTSIGNDAFNQCSKLKFINIPEETEDFYVEHLNKFCLILEDDSEYFEE